MNEPIREVLSRLKRWKESAAKPGEYEAICPSHDDHRMSLSVGHGRDGQVLLNCHAGGGCTFESIVSALGMQPADLWPADDGSPTPRPRAEKKTSWNVVAEYDYRDEAGCLLYQVVRMEPKDFRQRRRGPGGEWVWNLRGVRPVLYRLPELLQSGDAVVYVAEGEKDVDALGAMGLTATCNSGGAGKWNKPEYANCLKGRRVVVLPDNDDAGRNHAADVVKSLQGVAASCVVLALPGLPEKGDVSDWIAAGGTREGLEGLVAGLSPVEVVSEFPEPVPFSRLKEADPSLSWIWNGYLMRGEITLMPALWKAGKTTLLAHLIRAMAEGGEFLGRELAASKVLYVTEESETRWAKRRRELLIGDHAELLARPFRTKPDVPTWERFIDYVGNLIAKKGYDVVFFDTLANLWPVRDENDASAVQASLMPLHTIISNVAMQLVHHTRKSDGMEATASRGSGALTGFVDTILEFRRLMPQDRKDRRRMLSGYGRHDETPQEMVIELKEDGQYVSLGGRDEVVCANLLPTLVRVLLSNPGGITQEQIIDKWPEDSGRPGKKRLGEVLDAALESGHLLRTGQGVRGKPYVYWPPTTSAPTIEEIG